MEALFAVEQVGGGVPNIAQVVDAELVVAALHAHHDVTFIGGYTQLDVAYAGVIENLLYTRCIVVAHLDDYTRVLGKECLHDIGANQLVQADLHTALYVGKAHLQQGGNQTAGRDVVTSHYQPFVDQLLYGHEGIAEVFGVLHGRYVAAHLAL